jgi:hypothetical protein
MVNETVRVQEYSAARSATKAAGEVLRMAAGFVAAAALALATEPEFTARLLALVAGYPKLTATVGGLVFLGRFLLDRRKHKA